VSPTQLITYFKAPGDGNILLSQLIDVIEKLHDNLKEADRIVSKDRKVNYRVIAISHAKNYKLTLTAEVQKESATKPEAGIHKFAQALEDIQSRNKIPEGYDVLALEKLKDFTKGIGSTFESILISSDESEISLKPDFYMKIDDLLGPDESTFGTIKGMLEMIDIHGSPKRCNIYPIVGPTRIRGTFSSEMMNAIIEGIGKYVLASGRLDYKRGTEHPYHISIQKIEVLRPQKNAKNLSEMKAMAKGKGSEHALNEREKEQNDEWG